MSEALTQVRPIETITAEILIYKGQAGAAILEIGRRLIEAKEQLEHGSWSTWLAEQVCFSERSAQNFMRLAREYPNPQTFADLGTSKALALLEVPAEERETFAAQVDAEHCSVRELREAIKARDEALNQAKGWEMKCAAAKADADQARESAKKREQETVLANSTITRLTEEKKKLKAEVKELKSKPVEVAVQDASPEQIEQARAEGRSEAQAELARLRADLEKAKKIKPLPEATGRAMVEINLLFGQIQTDAARIRDLMGQLDDVTRARVSQALATVLREVG